MPTQVGPVKVTAPDKQVEFTRQMFRSVDSDVDLTKIIGPEDWQFVFGPVGLVPGTKTRAWGFFRPPKLKIRHGMTTDRDLKKIEVQYTEAHELFGHGGDRTMLRNDQRESILREMGLGPTLDAGVPLKQVWRRGDVPEGAKLDYWAQPYEAYSDMLVSALTNLPSIFEKRYVWDIDADKLKEIVLRPAPVIPVPDDPAPEPQPLPDPEPPLQTPEEKLAAAKDKAMEILSL